MEWSLETQLDNNKARRLRKRQTAHVTFYSGIPAHLSVDICVDIVIEENSSDMDSPKAYHQHFNGCFKMTCHWMNHCSLPKNFRFWFPNTESLYNCDSTNTVKAE